jgi:hypothetical protein
MTDISKEKRKEKQIKAKDVLVDKKQELRCVRVKTKRDAHLWSLEPSNHTITQIRTNKKIKAA